jgi:hypothetical protein
MVNRGVSVLALRIQKKLVQSNKNFRVRDVVSYEKRNILNQENGIGYPEKIEL